MSNSSSSKLATVWIFPESDFPEWKKLQEENGSIHPAYTFADYKRKVNNSSKQLAREGGHVVHVHMGVADMKILCEQLGVRCDARGRGRALRLYLQELCKKESKKQEG